MAIPATAAIREVPKFLLLSEYTVRRIGKYPSVSVRFVECVYLLSAPLVIRSTTDLNQDGLVEVLTVADLGAQPEVAGHLLSDLSSNVVGTIVGHERVELTPAVLAESDGSVVTPATYETKLTLDAGITPGVAGAPLAVVEKMPVGTNAYRAVEGGRVWEITLPGHTPEAMQEMGKLLGGAYFIAGKALLAKLGAMYTDAQVLGALQALAAEGSNIDGFLAQQGETIESKRRAGLLPFAHLMGTPA